jgi:hypothetical protein
MPAGIAHTPGWQDFVGCNSTINLNNGATFANSQVINYNTTTRNNLYGAQVGAITRILDDDGPFTISCASKAGIYGNAATNHWNIGPTLLSADQRILNIAAQG